MHTVVARINNGSAFLSSCLMTLLAAIALSSFLFTADPKGALDVASVQIQTIKAQRYPHRKQEAAFVNFNITADLTPLFNWNTKQLFVYLEAEYENAGVKNEVVVWDRIVRRREDAHIKVVGKNKYYFHDIAKSFKKSEPSYYSLKYNVMPYVGVLTYGEAARTTEPVAFPKS